MATPVCSHGHRQNRWCRPINRRSVRQICWTCREGGRVRFQGRWQACRANRGNFRWPNPIISLQKFMPNCRQGGSHPPQTENWRDDVRNSATTRNSHVGGRRVGGWRNVAGCLGKTDSKLHKSGIQATASPRFYWSRQTVVARWGSDFKFLFTIKNLPADCVRKTNKRY